MLPAVQSQNGGFRQAQFAVAVYVARASSGMMTAGMSISWPVFSLAWFLS